MNLFLENVNLRSTSGPNHFASKLVKYLSFRGVSFDEKKPYNKKLTFIQSVGQKNNLPMVLRLDGIYFNGGFDCDKMNHNIKNTYHKSDGIIFQTEFNKNLIFKWFGEHPNTTIINNGADVLEINKFKPVDHVVEKFKHFDNVWSCAASWHPFKRLKSNIEYFLHFSGPNDCLIVAGDNPDYVVENPRIFYVGNLSLSHLYTVYYISKFFIHLAYLDHCPNVVIDARAFGCEIICASAGGTKEISGINSTIVQEDEWDFSYIKDPNPPKLQIDNLITNNISSDLSMVKVAKKYHNFIRKI